MLILLIQRKRRIDVQNVDLKTATVDVQVITVSKRKMTLSA